MRGQRVCLFQTWFAFRGQKSINSCVFNKYWCYQLCQSIGFAFFQLIHVVHSAKKITKPLKEKVFRRTCLYKGKIIRCNFPCFVLHSKQSKMVRKTTGFWELKWQTSKKWNNTRQAFNALFHSQKTAAKCMALQKFSKSVLSLTIQWE